MFRGHGTIRAALYDLGLYPGAVRDTEGLVRGELHEMTNRECVLATLDDLEGYRPEDPATSLYTRQLVPVTLDEGVVVEAWAYFYNAPLGRAQRIVSGDYLEYLKLR